MPPTPRKLRRRNKRKGLRPVAPYVAIHGIAGFLRSAAVEGDLGQRFGYEWELSDVEGSRELVVCLSSTAAIQRWVPNTAWNMFYLTDNRMLYYTFRVSWISRLILAYARRRNVERIAVIGGSKGGFGALILAGALAKGDPDLPIHCLSFCPQTQIYPLNHRIAHMGGYRRLRDTARRDREVAVAIRANGDGRYVTALPNLELTLIYNEFNAVDVGEAEAIVGEGVRRIKLPFAFHNATIPFMFRGMTERRLARSVDVIYSQMSRDPDLAEALPADRAEFVAALRDTHWIPAVEDLVTACFAGTLDAIGPDLPIEEAA